MKVDLLHTKQCLICSNFKDPDLQVDRKAYIEPYICNSCIKDMDYDMSKEILLIGYDPDVSPSFPGTNKLDELHAVKTGMMLKVPRKPFFEAFPINPQKTWVLTENYVLEKLLNKLENK